MTVFVYISRRPKVFNRPKKRLYNPPNPSNLSWKKPLRPRGRPTRVWRAYQRRIHLRYQPKPPPPSNLSWKIPLRRRWQPRRFLARLFVQQRRAGLRYQPFPPPPAGFAPTKHTFRIRIRRGKRFVKTPKLYSIAGPPARFIAAPPRRRLRLRSRPMARFFRPRARGAIVPPPLVLFRALRRLRLKRRVLRGPRARYPVMVAPVGFVTFKKPPRPKIRRARIRVRPRNYSILPAALLLFRKLPRLRIKRARRFVKFPRLYSIAGPPVGFIAQKRMLRPRIKRAKFRVRPRLFPILPSLTVLYRKLPRLKIKRPRRFTKLPRLYSIAGPPAGFAPFVLGRILQLHSRPLARFFRPRQRAVILPGPPVLFRKAPRLRIKRGRKFVFPRRYSIAGPPVGFTAFKKPPRPKIRRARIRVRIRPYPIVTALLVMYRALRRLKIKRGRRFIKFPRVYSIAGPPTGFIAFKKPPRAKVRRWKSSLRQFAKRLYSFEGIAPLPPPIVLPLAGGGKRKRKTRAEIERERKIAAAVEQARQALSPGDKARSEIAKKLRRAVKSEGLLITEEEMFLLLHALEDDDED